MTNSLKKTMFLMLMTLMTLGLFAQKGSLQKMPKVVDRTTSSLADAFPVNPLTANESTTAAFTSIPLGNRGNIAQAMHLYPATQHDSWDVTDPATPEYHSAFSVRMRGGEFLNGIWYCYDADMNFYKVDPATGIVLTKIPNVNTVTFQDIAYNYATNTMYGVASNILYSINVETGVATQAAFLSTISTVMTFAINLNGTAYGITADDGILYTIDLTTGTCTEVGVTGKGCAYMQSMGFDHNTETLYWGQCSAIDDMNFCEVDLTTGTAAILASNFGEFNGFFVPYFNNPNIASAPSNFTVTPDADLELSATLSWTNPATTVGNIPLTAISALKIFRNGELIHTISNPTPGAAQTWVDNSIPAPDNYSYYMYVVTSAGDGVVTSDFVAVGATCTVTVYGQDSYGDGWNGAYIRFVDAQGIPRGTFTVANGFESTQQIIFPSGSNINCIWVAGDYDSEVNQITITQQGGNVLYTSPAAPTGLFCNFTNNCAQNIPNPPTNFLVTPNAANLTNILTWTNPTSCINGAELVMTSITISRNETVIQTINNPVNGADETYVDQLLEPGIYTYTIFVSNESGNSESVSFTVTIGGSYQMAFGQMIEITTCSGVIYDNGGSNSNYASYSNDTMIIYPATEGAKVAINGTYAIESNYDFLYVYDGVGLEGTLLHTYSYTNGGTVGDVSSSGPLTLHFTSDQSIEKVGFAINVSCTAPTVVTGTVANLTTGAPIENATVNFIGVGGGTAVTDALGNYSASVLTGIFDITVTAEGYNTIEEIDYVVEEGGASGKNFAMTAPIIDVNLDSISLTIPYLGTTSAEVTISNTGNGPLTFVVDPEYAEDRNIRSLNSRATIALNGTDIRKFILNNPSETIPLATAPNFMNSAEYVNGKFYFASGVNGAFGTINIESGTMTTISTGNPYGSIAFNYADGNMYGISLANGASILYRVDMETGAATVVKQCQMGFVLGMAINNDGRFFLIDAMAGGICELNTLTGTYSRVLSPGFSVNSGQDITCDHNENEIYWAAYNGNLSISQLYHIDVDEEVFTLIGTFEAQASCFAIEGPTGWLKFNPVTDVIEAQESETVTLTADGSFGLLPGTYHATARFSSKNPNVGSDSVKVTLVVEEPACGSPQNLTATAHQEDTTIDIQWEAVQDALYYTVYVNTEVLLTDLTTTSATLSNLNYDFEYCIEVVAVCSEGVGIPSNEVCVTIPAPFLPVITITVDEVTETTVAASFDANEDCASYYILIGIQSEMEMWMQMMQATLEQLVQQWGLHIYSDTSYVWTGQTPNTEYTIYALPLDAEGLIYEIQTQTVTTPGGGGLGESVIAIELSEITASSVRMIATPNEHTAVFHDGLIMAELFNEIGQDSAIEIIKNNGYPLYEIDDWTWNDLTPNTTYKAIAIGKNADDVWGEATIDEFTTSDAAPCDPPTLSSELGEYEGNIAILLSWTAVEGATLYTIYINGESLGNTENMSAYITGVEAGVEYCFTVTATCAAGESDPSNESCATIPPAGSFVITATASENGTITPSGNVVVEEGASQTFAMSANEGYQIEDVLVDGESIGTVDTYTFENVTENHTIAVTFTIKPAVSEMDARFSIYPNPANDKVTIDGENIASISVYNVVGQHVETVKTTTNRQTISTVAYENGVYIFRITTQDGNIVTKRVVIAH
ncbi:MAG: T9SS type A sorting domain-containing protein [Bacteroidales bacterium]|nr:T9SS type A sorting domain-containing protein [Bacteroidales bacterium]